MSRPLVTIVTPTWQRPALLVETVEHIREQDYPNLEHIIISDGLAPDLRHDLWAAGHRPADLFTAGGSSRLTLLELGRNWSGLAPASFGIAPLTAGYLLARGEYILPWCDDERALTPSHISRLVALLEESGADFAYPRVRIWRNGNPDGPETAIIGTDPPESCQITHYLFRASTLHRFGFPRWGTHPVDWSLIDDWCTNGAAWAYLPDCTFEHRLDR